MEEPNDILAEQQRELERIRKKRHHRGNMEGVRKVLNVLFLVLALVQVVVAQGRMSVEAIDFLVG